MCLAKIENRLKRTPQPVSGQTPNQLAYDNLMTLGDRVVFLKVASLVIETYESKDAAMKSGAVDHIALDVKDIEKTYELINQEGLNTTKDPIHFLPFWENGVKFFTIEGPNKEKVEFSQYL